MRTKLFLESTQNQRCFNVEIYRRINGYKWTLNQRGYHVDRRCDVIATYINVESTLSVCWVKNKIISVNEIIKTNEWSVVFVKTAYEEPFIELVNNFCKDLVEFEGTLEENEENKNVLDEYEQIASEVKETLMILKEKINEKFQNEEKVKKSQEREREQEEKKKERKHKLEKQKIQFESERIQAEERELKMTMEERLTLEKLTEEKMKVEGRKNCHRE